MSYRTVFVLLHHQTVLFIQLVTFIAVEHNLVPVLTYINSDKQSFLQPASCSQRDDPQKKIKK